MPVWTNFVSGNWEDATKWTGGVPDGAGEIAEFTVSSAGSGAGTVSINDGTTISLGTLKIVTDADDGWQIRGATGATRATLDFRSANGGPAYINVDTNGSSRDSEISGANNLGVNFASDVILSTLNTATFFRISAPISGGGDLFKFGTGTLALTGNNSGWTGGLNLFGGRTEVSSAASTGSAPIRIDNFGTLVATSNFTLANRIDIGSGSGSGTVAAAAGRTLTLSGQLVASTDNVNGTFFGNSADNGTIILAGTNLILGSSGFFILGATVRFANAGVAANYFSNIPTTGELKISAGGVLDTNGHAAFVDNLALLEATVRSGTGVLDLTINDATSDNDIQSGTIQGTGGTDRIVVNASINYNFSRTEFSSWTNGTDTLTINGNGDNNNLTGSSQNDVLNGFGGNDVLIGGGGADTMVGAAGNDIYRIEEAGDVVVELAGGGIDSVYTFISYTLAAGSEVELLSAIDPNGTTALTLTGNEFANFVIGNNGSNTLIGGAGSDTLIGNGGNDFYRVEDSDDKITEGAGGGMDSAYAVGNYTLAAGAQVELLSAIDPNNTVAMNLTGNEFDNFVIGNNGVNTLIGGAGSDTLIGNGGNDFYRVEDSGDKITETAGGGMDSAYAVGTYTLQAGAEVELLSAIDPSNTVAMNLTGNEFVNRLIGNNGANVINGGGGSDVLTGFGGADAYVFTTALGAGNIDLINDFVAVDDTIWLDDAVFAAAGAPGALAGNAFVTGAAATTAAHRIIYDSTTGALFYDADGNGAGAAVQFATLSPGLTLFAGDFLVI